MKIAGFTAEATLYHKASSYYRVAGRNAITVAQVLPQGSCPWYKAIGCAAEVAACIPACATVAGCIACLAAIGATDCIDCVKK